MTKEPQGDRASRFPGGDPLTRAERAASKACEDQGKAESGSGSSEEANVKSADSDAFPSAVPPLETAAPAPPLETAAPAATSANPTTFEAVVGEGIDQTVVTTSLPSEQVATIPGSSGVHINGRGASVERRNTGAVRSAGSRGAQRTVWEPRGYPKWWLVAPSAMAVVGLVGWQMNGIRHDSEEDLHDRALNVFRQRFPGAGLRFHGRDAVISAISPKDRQAAHDLVRGVRGVRNVEERVVGGSLATTATTTAASSTAPTTPAVASTATTTPAVASTATTTAAVASTMAAPSTTIGVATTMPPASDLESPPTTSARPTTQAATPAVAVEVVRAPNGPIQFASSSCELSTLALANLDEVASYLETNADVRLQISGHADATGTKVANLNYSTCRADAVRSALTKRGIDGSRLTSFGRGSRVPIASNATSAGRHKNRRVDLRYLGDRTVSYTG